MYLKTSKSTCNVPINRSARTKLHDSKFASSTSLWNIIFISCTTHSGTASSALPGSHPWRATPRQSQVMVSNWTTGGLGWWNRCSYEEAVGYLRCHQDQLCELQVDGSPHMSKNGQIIEVHGGHDTFDLWFLSLDLTKSWKWLPYVQLPAWNVEIHWITSWYHLVFLSLPGRWLFRTRRMFFGGFGGAPKSMSNVEDRFPGGNTKQNI